MKERVVQDVETGEKFVLIPAPGWKFSPQEGVVVEVVGISPVVLVPEETKG
jgi:hypothetical protein